MNIELKPCPFCGEEAKLKEIAGRYAIECSKHCAGTVIKNDKSKVIEIWNRRTEK